MLVLNRVARSVDDPSSIQFVLNLGRYSSSDSYSVQAFCIISCERVER